MVGLLTLAHDRACEAELARAIEADLDGLEQVSRLPTPARGLGRPRHVQFLLLLRDVGQHRGPAFVFDNGSLVDLRPLVEGPVG
jgi:hypothetical protein